MRYLKAYFESVVAIAIRLGAVLLVIELLSGNSALAAYFAYVALLAGFAGPIREAIR